MGRYIKMDRKELECEAREWINLAQDRDQETGFCEDGNEVPVSLKCEEFT
jgi:hypothetical protein